MNNLYTISLMPIEPLMFGDNRSARAGEDHIILDQDPSPHTIFSSISIYIMKLLKSNTNILVDSTKSNWDIYEPYLGEFKTNIKDDDKERAELVGYCFLNNNQTLWFPRPQHFAVFEQNNLFYRGNKYQITTKTEHASSCPFKAQIDIPVEENKEEYEGDCYISQYLLEKILADDHIGSAIKLDILPLEDFYKPENRLGIRMMDNNTIEEGMLFSRPYRRFKQGINNETKTWSSNSYFGWYKTKKALLPEQIKKGVTFLGGDRGRAIAKLKEAGTQKPLESIRESVKANIANSKGFYCYLMTPAVLEEDWPSIQSKKPIAAAIGKEKYTSGWSTDKTNQFPRPILKLVHAGSVFFFEWENETEEMKKKLVDDLWFEPISNNYRTSGFGRMLIGVWK